MAKSYDYVAGVYDVATAYMIYGGGYQLWTGIDINSLGGHKLIVTLPYLRYLTRMCILVNSYRL